MTRIQFFDDVTENVLPIIQLTKSKNGKTGTATFVFFHPTSFEIQHCRSLAIQTVSLLWNKNENRIRSNDFTLIFHEGKPKGIKVVFLFKNSKEWFEFFSFMNYYSKQTDLSFSGNSLVI